MQCQWTRQLCKAQPAQHAAVTLYWRLQLQARTQQQFCLACTSRLGLFPAVNEDSPYTLATDKRLVQSHQKLDIALRTMTYSHVMLPQTQMKYTRCQHRSGHTHNHSTSTELHKTTTFHDSEISFECVSDTMHDCLSKLHHQQVVCTVPLGLASCCNGL